MILSFLEEGQGKIAFFHGQRTFSLGQMVMELAWSNEVSLHRTQTQKRTTEVVLLFLELVT